MSTPLADRIRPERIEDVVGQRHLLGEGRLLGNIIKKGENRTVNSQRRRN